MNKKFCFKAILFSLLFASCANEKAGNQTLPVEPVDTVSVVVDTVPEVKEDTVVPLVADSQINLAASFYAGLNCDTLALSKDQNIAWAKYSKQIGDLKKKSFSTLAKADSLVGADMSDLRERCNFVFYPFSGPDFLYPISLFPDADYYFMVGLEPPGKMDTTINADKRYFDMYTKSLKIYMRSSFFRTLSMKNDFNSEEIDGTAPVISMLMAMKDCQIISTRDVEIDSTGAVVDAVGDKKRRMVEFKFFKKETPLHEQTLYYFSGNVNNQGFPQNLQTYLDTTLPKYEVVTYLKAASYLLHEAYFSKMRNIILDYSFAVLEDDSGIPYRFFKDNWDVQLYGKYVKPINIFKPKTYQTDLEEVYDTCSSIKPLPIRIGYNHQSNWCVARKKENK
ncbi:MAG: hypothetical protein MJZ00_06560 [Paludibacteraceae bacterium]|nr:hypothetical protein [Paludibacteraceae bacterium]